jgi:hypothetical protein
VLVGLGEAGGAVTVRVSWPDGQLEEWRDQPADRWITLTQGKGTRVAARRAAGR